jgi:Flp pilus assembly protein TadG
MKHQKTQRKSWLKGLRNLAKKSPGQVMVFFAIMLPVFFAVGGLAVDGGHLMVARNVYQNAADAGAFAGATIMAQTSDQALATNEAVRLSNLNNTNILGTGAATAVAFPSANTVRVTVSRNVPLFLMPAVGITTGLVSATATAQFGAVSAAPPGSLVPVGIACNEEGTDFQVDSCYGYLAIGQTFTTRRFCGNYFMDGPDGNLCGNEMVEREVFLQGWTNDKMMSTATFRDNTYNGIPYKVWYGDTEYALPANRNGWKFGMIDRLAEGRNMMILPILKGVANPQNGIDRNIMIHGFVQVEMQSIESQGNTDTMTFTVIKHFNDQELLTPGQGTPLESVFSVNLTQ